MVKRVYDFTLRNYNFVVRFGFGLTFGDIVPVKIGLLWGFIMK